MVISIVLPLLKVPKSVEPEPAKASIGAVSAKQPANAKAAINPFFIMNAFLIILAFIFNTIVEHESLQPFQKIF